MFLAIDQAARFICLALYNRDGCSSVSIVSLLKESLVSHAMGKICISIACPT